MATDYYDTLGVSKGATKDEIKKAYKKLAKKYHPDISKAADAEQKFKEVNEAFSVLSDDQKRAHYDQFGTTEGMGGPGGAGGAGFGGFGGGGFEDIFEAFGDIFGGGRSRRPRGPRRGNDLRYDMEISLEDAAFGGKKSITLKKLAKCETCKGLGGKDVHTCETCNGSGVVNRTARTPFGMIRQQVMCSACGGEGNQVKDTCDDCGGDGVVREKKTLEVTIPPGVEHGTRLRLRDEGEPGPRGGPTGDLYVVIYVKPHDVFERRGSDIYLEVPIGFAQATLGDEIEVPTLEGKAKLKIPANTQTHTIMKMKGKGMPLLNSSYKGDQLVRVIVQTPKKLSKKQKELIAEFGELQKEKPSKSFLERVFGK